MKQVDTIFTRHELSEAEEATAAQFSYTTYVWLKNQQANIAEQKLALVFDTSNPAKFTQEEAYLAGQLDILSYILATRESAIANSSDNQPE